MPLATALIIAAAAYAAKGKDEAKNSDGDNGSGQEPDITPAFLEGKTPIELLPLEQKLTIFEHPISTVSFYECPPSTNTNVLIRKLQSRVEIILKANPWLGGWLVRGKGVGSFDNTHRLWYDPTGEEMAPTIFQHLSFKDAPLRKSTELVDYEDILSKSAALVKDNPLIVNRKGEPLFRVTVILEPRDALDSAAVEVTNGNEETDDSRMGGFALVVSMSHVCGDAHTYYRIYNMLLGLTPVTALISQRELEFSTRVMDLMGKQEAHYVSHITTDPAWAKLFRLSSDVNDDPEAELQGRMFLVNRHWVGNIKAQSLASGNISDVCKSTLRSPMSNAFVYELESSQNPTQSTNDILVSWFWNAVKPDVGMMAVNLRDRIGVVSNNHVGNYNNPISYTQEDYKTPQLIRESLRSCKRSGVAEENGVPTVLPRAHPGLSFSIVTNWSSFRPLSDTRIIEEDDDDSEWNRNDQLIFVRHVPLMYPKQMLKSMPRRMSFMVIFSSGEEDIGCFLAAPGRVMKEVDSCGLVKEMLAQF
ncbi:hypothetical protein HJC23_008599 [Cyclotella cryptica]|uniref:Uncharacterized protein n=1 Tax=Cyclotella cryptica TaxID=29204 RepID=A0ABD3Q8I1_9STRA|eukprot:CCRYP_007959-RA/>CCRYP_007959-RA protein AED:0.01 eAED:0.01 QI:224/-1/1/1/-1/1/1/520/530